MLENPRSAYLLWDFEPDFDIANPALALAALSGAEKVIAVSSFATDHLEALADVILPLAPLAESEGTVHSLDGNAIAFEPAGKAAGESRPGWKILRRLGAALGLDEFDQVDLAELRAEMESALSGDAETGAWPEVSNGNSPAGLHRVGELPMFGVDALCRRSDSLQKTVHADSHFVALNPEDAKGLGLEDGGNATVTQGEASVDYPVRVTETVAAGGAWVRSSTCSSRTLGDSFAPIEVKPGGAKN
ncbi:MAG: molybdopterin-dependent oxidoreductase [Xanthomonadales bacterium]|nr:molybdopterin-dependent oxidoreductase [Xanthomonadales bacterium]